MPLILPKIGLITRFLVLSSFFLVPISHLAQASLLGDYNPRPPENIDQRTTVGSGSRSLSCQKLFPKNSLTLLVPKEEVVHYTVSSSPSFYLYAQASETVPLIFNLVIPDPTANNPILEGTLVIEQPGLHEIKLPAEVELETGQIYLWQIGIPCKNNPQEIDQVIKAAVKKVRIDPELAHQLELADSPLPKAQIYASSGIWYDAFSLAAQKAVVSATAANYVQKLGQEAGIKLKNTYFSSSIP